MICKQCSIEFTPIKSGYWRKRKFCSLKCNSLNQKGKKRVFSKQWRENIGKAMKGRIMTEEHKKRIGLAHKGRKHPELSKYNKLHSGENHNNWQGGISSLNVRFRMTKEFQDWRKAVYKRDNYTCRDCGKRGNGNLNADHIKPFCIFPELRLVVSNGQTLCEIPCHKNKTKEDWELIKRIRVNFRV